MDEDHWTVVTEGYNSTTFSGPFLYFIQAYWWARNNVIGYYDITFQDMSPYRSIGDGT